MPLPSPILSGPNRESEREFVSRCAGSKIMNSEYKDQRQKLAICFEIYRRAVKKKRAKGSEEEPTWEEIEAEIQSSGTIQGDDTLKILTLNPSKK